MNRFRITFSRTEALRYTGNLDMQKVWERYLRRAGIPVAYSNGFHPQARIQLACPLPLGFLSDQEIVDIWVDEEGYSFENLGSSFATTNQPGIEIIRIEPVELSSPALATCVQSADYRVVLFDPVDEAWLRDQIDRLCASNSILRERRGKKYDLRPLVENLELEPSPEGTALIMRLSARDSATGRPEEVLAALNLDRFGARYIRSGLVLKTC